MPVPYDESSAFLGAQSKAPYAEPEKEGCMRSTVCSCCCGLLGLIGVLLVLLGLVVVLMGPGMLEEQIQESMALTPGSDRTESWLNPPVQPHLTGYAFHVVNPDAILRGAKPIVEERGPYVYKSVTIKDSNDNMVWHDEDGTLEYRPRKIYTYEPDLSGPGLDPYNDYITVPNIPLWTGLNGLKGQSGFAKDIGRELITGNGLGTPFINVTFDGLLWGYQDDLPCLKMDHPDGCPSAGDDEDDPFSDDDDGGWGDDWKRRRKRSVDEFEGLSRPKAEFVNCSCQWGLFRDRNVTLRKPVRFFTGVTDLAAKGIVTEFDGAKTLGWWEEGSHCDAVGGQDSSTLPPSITANMTLDIFISLMCRSIPVTFEQEVEHKGIRSLRFIPPPNAMGAHDDPDPARRNPANKCYCMEEQGFRCYKSGVLNMEPCKRDSKPPLALSYPHFYEADPSFVEAVEGLNPDKEKHQFFMDVVPEFGFPLAIRPRFQLNVVVGSALDPGWELISNMREEIVLPFLWAQDGFDEPSDEMAEDIAFGIDAPDKIPLLASIVCFILGALAVIGAAGYFIWRKRS